uniref:Uncharacterized protein n=1 Tax=Cacopsylla melanoneura TaxID=428564 RepID=A0A8D9F0L2_9HEMI
MGSLKTYGLIRTNLLCPLPFLTYEKMSHGGKFIIFRRSLSYPVQGILTPEIIGRTSSVPLLVGLAPSPPHHNIHFVCFQFNVRILHHTSERTPFVPGCRFFYCFFN